MMASETGIVVSVSKGEQHLERLFFEKDQLTRSTFQTDLSGVLWEVLDLNGDGIPDYRISRSGPHISETFSGGSFQPKPARQ
jgi:hypothetical protein